MTFHTRALERSRAARVSVSISNHVGWQFNLYQCVTHISQDAPSLVVGRIMASNGKEFYAVRSMACEDPNRDKIIDGEMLRDVISETTDCASCLLVGTPLCRGLR